VTLDVLRKKTGISVVWSLMTLLPVFVVLLLDTGVGDVVVIVAAAIVINLLAGGESMEL
jgi:hypothetical protein